MVIGDAVDGGVGALRPAGIGLDGIPGIADDLQRAGVGHGGDVRRGQQDLIVAGAGQIDDLEAADVKVGGGRKIQRDAACQHQ